MTIEEIKQKLADSQAIAKFSSFAKDALPMPGKKKHIDDVLGKEIKIMDYRITRSNKRENTDCLRLQFVDEFGEVCILFTGSSVLLDQIQQYKDKLPFNAIIIKIDKYYSFS